MKFEGCSIPFYECSFQTHGVRLPLTTFENEVLDQRSYFSPQLHPVAWAIVEVFQYWYENKGKIGSASKNIFFHFFFVNRTLAKKTHDQELVSFRHSSNNKFFIVYTESWNHFKPNYFLITPISLTAHLKFYNVPNRASGPISYTNKPRRY